jgi:hypothetical protein
MAKHEKMNGGKPKTGQSVFETAAAAIAENMESYAAAPHLFSVYTLTEEVGLAKNGDYLLKIGGLGPTSVEAFVDRRLINKSGKLVVKDFKVGSKVIVSSRSVSKKIVGGRYSADEAVFTEFRVLAAL